MRKIPNFSNYRITTDGDIYNDKTSKKLTNSVSRSGSLRVSIRNDKGERKTCQVHRLLATTYIQNLSNKPQVDHIDGDKQNNNINNLRWCTDEENQKYRIEQGTTGVGWAGKKIQWGGVVFPSIGELARTIAKIRGSKINTIKKELKQVRYGSKVMYGKTCRLISPS